MSILRKFTGWVAGGTEGLDLSSPEGVAKAAAVLEENGQLGEAATLLEEGVKRFPQSPAVRSLLERVQRRNLGERAAELTKTLQARPDPMVYLELVRIYRQIGDTVSARRVASEAIEKFANHAQLRQAVGELWLDVFEEGGATQDGIAAAASLQRCVELDPSNLNAQESLMRLYGLIGAWGKALQQAVAILNSLRPGPVGKIAAEALAKRGPIEDDVEALVRKSIRTREEAGQAASALPEIEGVGKVLREFRYLKGNKVAAVIAPAGTMIGAVMPEEMDKEGLAKAASGLAAAAAECCSRMSLGGFVMAQIEAPHLSGYLRVVPPVGHKTGESSPGSSATLFVLADSTARKREILARLAGI
jgi:tetratricopeptide (TPR) repeat protein